MTVELLIYAVIAGIAIVEGLRAALGWIGVQQRLSQVRATLRAFRMAADDEARQRLITLAGLRTLSLSSLLFATLVIGCVVVALPLTWTAMGQVTLMTYMVVLSLSAVIWWRLRRSDPSRR